MERSFETVWDSGKTKKSRKQRKLQRNSQRAKHQESRERTPHPLSETLRLKRDKHPREQTRHTNRDSTSACTKRGKNKIRKTQRAHPARHNLPPRPDCDSPLDTQRFRASQKPHATFVQSRQSVHPCRRRRKKTSAYLGAAPSRAQYWGLFPLDTCITKYKTSGRSQISTTHWIAGSHVLSRPHLRDHLSTVSSLPASWSPTILSSQEWVIHATSLLHCVS